MPGKPRKIFINFSSSNIQPLDLNARKTTSKALRRLQGNQYRELRFDGKDRHKP